MKHKICPNIHQTECLCDNEYTGMYHSILVFRMTFPSVSVFQSRFHFTGSRPGANSRDNDPCSTEEWQLGLPAKLSSGRLLDVSHGGAYQDLC